MAFERRLAVSAMLRQLIDGALGMRPGDPPPFGGGHATVAQPRPDVLPAPLLVVNVAAGVAPEVLSRVLRHSSGSRGLLGRYDQSRREAEVREALALLRWPKMATLPG